MQKLDLPDGIPEMKDPASLPGEEWDQATYTDKGKIEWATLKSLRSDLLERLESMTLAELEAAHKIHERRKDQLRNQISAAADRLDTVVEETMLESVWESFMTDRIRTLNLVRWRLRAIQFESSARAEGWHQRDSGPDSSPEAIDEVAAALIDVLQKRSASEWESRSRLLRTVDRKRGLNPSPNNRPSYKCLHNNLDEVPPKSDLQSWAEQHLESVGM